MRIVCLRWGFLFLFPVCVLGVVCPALWVRVCVYGRTQRQVEASRGLRELSLCWLQHVSEA